MCVTAPDSSLHTLARILHFPSDATGNFVLTGQGVLNNFG